MAAKKKTIDAPTVDEDGFMCLRGDLLWKWRAMDAELRAASLEMESTVRRVQIEISKHPDLDILLGRKAELAGVISASKTNLAVVQNEIEARFGVSLKECAFDDRTGRLYSINDGGERGEPMKAPKRRKR